MEKQVQRMEQIVMNCCYCGHKMDKPYAIWHWQSGKPAKSYCFLCWEQQIKTKSYYVKPTNRFYNWFMKLLSLICCPDKWK